MLNFTKNNVILKSNRYKRLKIKIIFGKTNNFWLKCQIWSLFLTFLTCPRSSDARVCGSWEMLKNHCCWAADPLGPRGGNSSPDSAAYEAVAAPVHTSASDAPKRSASLPRTASPGSSALTARGLRCRRRENKKRLLIYNSVTEEKHYKLKMLLFAVPHDLRGGGQFTKLHSHGKYF